MKKTLALIGSGLESSSSTTQQFLTAYRSFKSEFTKILKEIGCTDIKVGKGHFYTSGFFKASAGQMWYFSIQDFRDPASSLKLLYRTAKHDKDFTGGSNQWADLNDLKNSMRLTYVSPELKQLT